MKHKHHIKPRHEGGENHPSNLIELSIEEHAEAHRLLWEKNRKIEDYIAWKCLSGKTEVLEENRIVLGKLGYEKFRKDSQKVTKWKRKISQTLTGKKQTEESKRKRSESLKKAYREGRRVSSFSTMDRQFFVNNYDGDLLAEGRRKSKKWKDSVTSEEYRRKKSESDPRSQKVVIEGVTYPSIRSAAKSLKIPYSRLRSMLK